MPTISSDYMYACLFPWWQIKSCGPAVCHIAAKGRFRQLASTSLIKQKYKPSKQRIQEGKIAYRMWLQTPEGAGCTYTLPETDDEDDEEEEAGVDDVETKEEPAAKETKPRKQKKDTFPGRNRLMPWLF